MFEKYKQHKFWKNIYKRFYYIKLINILGYLQKSLNVFNARCHTPLELPIRLCWFQKRSGPLVYKKYGFASVENKISRFMHQKNIVV